MLVVRDVQPFVVFTLTPRIPIPLLLQFLRHDQEAHVALLDCRDLGDPVIVEEAKTALGSG